MKIKHPKSPTLTAVIKEWSRPAPLTKEWRRTLAEMADYPHNRRAEVFCWLWDNHAELVKMRRLWKPTWDWIALVMAEEGVKDRHGHPPTGNAARRVWGRVCREIEEENTS